MSKIGGQRNFGYGKTMRWAGQQALKDKLGEGRYATRHAHGERWARFAAFAKETGVKDARYVTRELIEAYGKHLAIQVESEAMKVAYAQNLLSSVNVVLELMRQDRRLRVSPGEIVGQRTNVRETAPASVDRNVVDTAVKMLQEKRADRVAIVVELARHLGLRFREASLIDAKAALLEADQHGQVNIVRGTKGGRGRDVDRWVPVSIPGRKALEAAAVVQRDARSLVPAEKTFHQWRMHAYGVWTPIAREHGIKGFHELRAAYTCERYQQLTGAPAPVLAGERTASKEDDKTARQVLAQELGHGRIDVLSSYIGSAR